VHTVSRLADLQAMVGSQQRPRAVVEVLTSIRRHGIAPDEIGAAASMLDGIRFDGWALHLPLTGDRLAEVRALTARLAEATGSDGQLWISHLDAADAAALGHERSAAVRVRIGTALWLGLRTALRARATVLDVHPVERGQRFGYRQRRASRSGHLLVIAGGTAHGIALEAPTPATSLRQRAVAGAKGGWKPSGGPFLRSTSPGSSGGSPSHHTCNAHWCGCRPRSIRPPWATKSTSTSA
jgi:alanine racemase